MSDNPMEPFRFIFKSIEPGVNEKGEPGVWIELRMGARGFAPMADVEAAIKEILAHLPPEPK